jgi:hypothetical protein
VSLSVRSATRFFKTSKKCPASNHAAAASRQSERGMGLPLFSGTQCGALQLDDFRTPKALLQLDILQCIVAFKANHAP